MSFQNAAFDTKFELNRTVLGVTNYDDPLT